MYITLNVCIYLINFHRLEVEITDGIAAQAQHTVVLTEDGHLYATGKGDFGRLGRGDTNDEVGPQMSTLR